MERSKQKTNSKFCVVCGDKSNGYNFNAITCESCKAFFRRNALRKKAFKCISESKCEINVITRRFCQKCRLQKCLNQGMNKNLILSDQEKDVMKNKIRENKRKKGENTSKENFKEITKNSELFKCFTQNSNNSDNDSKKTIQNSMHILSMDNAQANHVHYGKDLPIEQDEISNNEKVESVWSNIGKIISNAINRGLTSLEEKRLKELNDAFNCEWNDRSVDEISENVIQADILSLIDRSVRRLIKMTSRMECFSSLCIQDQMALMKANCTQIITLRSIKNYNFKEQIWRLDKSEKSTLIIKLESFKQSALPTNLYETHYNIMKVLSEEWELDINILNLLSAIILFNPNIPNIIHKQLIAFEYKCHQYLLQRYLDTKYSSKSQSNEKYNKLMRVLYDLYLLNQEGIRWHLESHPQRIGPLLIEIFNIND